MRPSRAAFGWGRGAAYWLLLAMAVSLTELAVYGGGSPREVVDGVVRVLPSWVATTLPLVLFAAWGLPRLPAAQLALGSAVVATGCGLLQARLTVRTGPLAWTAVALGTDSDIATNAAFSIWVLLFYGGLFVGLFALLSRAERTRTLLGRAEIARSRGEALLHEAQLATLRGSVDPQLVLRALDAMASRFATDPAGADRLLDRLVGFLRLAMPGVRSGASTLGAEIAIVRSFEQVADELAPQRPRWRCDADGSLAELAFPPLLLLPLLERLGTPAAIVATRDDRSGARLRIDSATAAPLDAELLYRLRVGLHALYGDAIRVDVCPGTLLIDLPLPPPTAAPRAPVSDAPFRPIPSTHPGEPSPWTTTTTAIARTR